MNNFFTGNVIFLSYFKIALLFYILIQVLSGALYALYQVDNIRFYTKLLRIQSLVVITPLLVFSGNALSKPGNKVFRSFGVNLSFLSLQSDSGPP